MNIQAQSSDIKHSAFRMRGDNMTRIEAFVAAAFAFAITMLVISVGSIPSSFTEFILSVKQIPAFTASSAILFWIWHSHANWCRRYGLEDGRTVMLSGVLIFLVLIYVYPLRIMMQGLFSALSNGYFPIAMQYSSINELRLMFIFYSFGFLLLSVNFIAFYWHANCHQQKLQLNLVEIHDTQADILIWSASAVIACLSLLMAIFMPTKMVVLSGYVYFLMFPLLTMLGLKNRKKRKALITSL